MLSRMPEGRKGESTMELYLFSLRVLVTLLILTLLLPGIGLLSTANAYEEVPVRNEDTVGRQPPLRR